MGDEYIQELLNDEDPKENRTSIFISLIITLGGLIGAGIFFSFNLTGSAVRTIDPTASNWAGSIFLVFAIIGMGLLYKKSKKNKKVKIALP